MPSSALDTLKTRLSDFDELMEARDSIVPPKLGKPARRRGAAIIRAAVVLLAAAFEAFVEDLYDQAADILFESASSDDLKQLKKNTSGKFSNADAFKINMLFFNLGIPWIMKKKNIRWQKFSNSKVNESLNKLIHARNQIAHGKNPGIRKATAMKWRGLIERLAERLDIAVADELETKGLGRPW